MQSVCMIGVGWNELYYSQYRHLLSSILRETARTPRGTTVVLDSLVLSVQSTEHTMSSLRTMGGRRWNTKIKPLNPPLPPQVRPHGRLRKIPGTWLQIIGRRQNSGHTPGIVLAFELLRSSPPYTAYSLKQQFHVAGLRSKHIYPTNLPCR